MFWTVVGISLSVAASSYASPVSSQIGLISVTDVQALMKNVDTKKKPLIFDTRGGYKDYFTGHLPDAHHINFDTLRGTENGVPVQYLPDAITKLLLQRAGVDRDRTHLLYAEGGSGDEVLSATMVAHVLEKNGVKDIRILDGGLPAFKAAAPLTQEYPKTVQGKLPTQPVTTTAANIEDVKKHLQKPNAILVDARPENEYLGKDQVWLRKGHIPGAINFPWRKLVEDSNSHKFKSLDSVKSQLEKAGITPDKDIIVYCGTSREGSLLRFYFKHIAHYPRVRLYEGSWKEYAALIDLPVETAMPVLKM